MTRPQACIVAAGAALGLLLGCAAGPDFQPPTTAAPTRFTAQPLPVATAGGAQRGSRSQRFVDAAATPVAWWTVLGSPEIDTLVQKSLGDNPGIAAAEAALRQAQALAAAQRGAFFPTVGFEYVGNRARVPAAVSSPVSSNASVYTLQTAQVGVSYAADVFGGNRRAVESLQAQALAQAWQLRAARLTLAANVANAALQEAALREQLDATEGLRKIAVRQLELVRAQLRLGQVAGAAALLQEAQLHQAEAASAALRKALAQQHDLLAALVGLPPSELAATRLTLASLSLPDVPTGLPARLLDQRPDVQAALAQLHAANAGIGVAVSNMLPQITLSADYGASAAAFGQLFRAGSLLWGLGADVAQPLFDSGALRQREQAAEAGAAQALAQYRSTVLGAFQNVADALEAVQHDADADLAATGQARAAEAALAIVRRQLALGDLSALEVLAAQAAAQQAAIARIQVEAGRFSDVLAVYQALGGSWQEAPPDTAARP